MKPQKVKGPSSNQLPSPAFCPFVCLRVGRSKKREAFNFKPARVSKNPFSGPLGESVTPSLSRYNDSLRRSEVLMPIGYLSRISHTFMHEPGSLGCGRRSDWIVRSQFSLFKRSFPLFTLFPLPWSVNRDALNGRGLSTYDHLLPASGTRARL